MHDVQLLVALGDMTSQIQEKLNELYQGKFVKFFDDDKTYEILKFTYLLRGLESDGYCCKVKLDDGKSLYRSLLTIEKIIDA